MRQLTLVTIWLVSVICLVGASLDKPVSNSSWKNYGIGSGDDTIIIPVRTIMALVFFLSLFQVNSVLSTRLLVKAGLGCNASINAGRSS